MIELIMFILYFVAIAFAAICALDAAVSRDKIAIKDALLRDYEAWATWSAAWIADAENALKLARALIDESRSKPSDTECAKGGEAVNVDPPTVEEIKRAFPKSYVTRFHVGNDADGNAVYADGISINLGPSIGRKLSDEETDRMIDDIRKRFGDMMTRKIFACGSPAPDFKSDAKPACRGCDCEDPCDIPHVTDGDNAFVAERERPARANIRQYVRYAGCGTEAERIEATK